MSLTQRGARYEAVVIGGGHNGLVCAAYLAKAGRKVLVLERRHVLGGAAVTEELHPGFQFSVCSYVVSLFRPSIIRDLDLAKHGMEIIPLETAFAPRIDDWGLCRWSDPGRTRHEISRFSARDQSRRRGALLGHCLGRDALNRGAQADSDSERRLGVVEPGVASVPCQE